MVKRLTCVEFLNTSLFSLFTSLLLVPHRKFWFCWALNSSALQFSVQNPFLELLYVVFLLTLHLFITSKLMVYKSNIVDTVSPCGYLFLNIPQESQWTCYLSPDLPLACVHVPAEQHYHLLNRFARIWEVRLENDGQRAGNFQIHSKSSLHHLLYNLLLVNISLTQEKMI